MAHQSGNSLSVTTSYGLRSLFNYFFEVKGFHSGVIEEERVECARAQGWSVPGPRGLGGAPESRVIKCIGKTSFDMRSGDD